MELHDGGADLVRERALEGCRHSGHFILHHVFKSSRHSQLLPLTPVAEYRDDENWIAEMYPRFKESCDINPDCEKYGWSILVYSALATLGQWKAAWQGINTIPADVYESAGGNGHSRTNTLWHIGTAKQI